MDVYVIQTADLQLTQLDLLIRLSVATGIGLLIGLEREYWAIQKQEHVFAGIRTFVLLSLLGFVGMALHFLASPLVMAMVFLGVIILTGMSYWFTATKGDIGGTSELAAIIAVMLGALTFLGFIAVSLMITVIVLVMLSSKVRLQNVIGQITREEIYALVRFVVVALLIFPFLPNETYDPFQVVNPREIGWVIILTSGLGFIGYVLMRVLGAGRGILLTGIVGGLVSSTAVTWVFSKKSKEFPEVADHCATAILAASSVMVLRVLLWVMVFNKALLDGLLVPVLLMFAAGAGVTWFYYRRQRAEKDLRTTLPLGKPLNLQQAIIFGLIYMVIILVVAYANDYFGQEGIYVTSGVAGLTDIDAVTISVSRLSAGTIPVLTAQNAILLAAVSNTLVKICIALWAGSKELRKDILTGYGLMFLAAVIGFLILNVF